MKCFEVCCGCVEEGIGVAETTLSNGKITVLTASVGERGPGRKLDFITVEPEAVTEVDGVKRVFFAEVGKTRRGAPKLIKAPACEESPAAIVKFVSTIGYRGGNSHHGAINLRECQNVGIAKNRDWWCVECGMKVRAGVPHAPKTVKEFGPLPAEVLARGIIAQGAAGRMGSGEQLIVKMNKGDIVTLKITGRLYGAPSIYIYGFDGKNMIALDFETWLKID